MSPSAATMAAESRTTRAIQLEERVRDLEEQVKLAEQAELLSVKKAQDWTTAVLSGKVNIGRAPLEPYISVYPSQPRRYPRPPYLKLTSELEPPPLCVVPREVLHQELLNWDQNDEIPVSLRRRL